MHQDRSDLYRERQLLVRDALGGRLSRRQILQRGAALGLGAASLSGLLGDTRRASAQTPSANLVSWAPGGQRWELPQRAVYPLFQEKFPDISVEWVTEPIADYIPRTVIEMSAKSDQFDVLHNDYAVVPQLIAMGSLEPLQARLEADQAYMDDLLADVPENVLDLYRDKPAADGGILYGLPPDSNCQLQYYRIDILEQEGFDGPAETWDEAIEIAKTLADSGVKQTGTTLRRGQFAGGVFITILRSYGATGSMLRSRAPSTLHSTLKPATAPSRSSWPSSRIWKTARSTPRTTSPTLPWPMAPGPTRRPSGAAPR